MNLNPAVAANVRRLRSARGWTHARLAEEVTNAGVSWERMTASKIESGDRSTITINELAALAGAFGIANPWLLTVPPSCGDCHGAPPAGYACLTCGQSVPK